jgi:hypothetical protein
MVRTAQMGYYQRYARTTQNICITGKCTVKSISRNWLIFDKEIWSCLCPWISIKSRRRVAEWTSRSAHSSTSLDGGSSGPGHFTPGTSPLYPLLRRLKSYGENWTQNSWPVILLQCFRVRWEMNAHGNCINSFEWTAIIVKQCSVTYK